MSNAVISVKGLKKSFKDKEVLKGVDFEVQRGDIFALLGSNGAGKTTTVNILSTLMKPDGGTTILLTTQYLEEAEQLADRIAILNGGKIITTGTLAELKEMFPPAKVEYIEKQPTLGEIFLAIIGKKEEM